MKLWNEIERAQFSLAVRGYDRGEVDEFIDATTTAVRDLEDRSAALHGKVKALESELAARRETSSSIEHAFLEAVEKKQLMLADAEKRANAILADAESHVANNERGAQVEALREQAKLMLDQASTMLEDAERESAMIRSKAAAEGERAVVVIKAEAERMLTAAEAEAAAIVAGAEQQRERLAAALRLLQDAVGEMLASGAERHEIIKMVLDEQKATPSHQGHDAAIA